ncbi:hypothetical protein NQD34_016088 [Periophthalmus magnuspinnatus]|nr:hypothetical protein NQD34_016088 [Periophthalmus magnuspinnatus]
MIYFCLFFLMTDGCLGLQVHQSVSNVIKKPNEKVQIYCTHEKTDYRLMLWYQQPSGDTAMKLIGYLHYEAVTMENQYETLCSISGDLGGTTTKNGSLSVQLEGPEQSGVYFCAASQAHQYKDSNKVNKNYSNV